MGPPRKGSRPSHKTTVAVASRTHPWTRVPPGHGEPIPELSVIFRRVLRLHGVDISYLIL